MTRARCPRSPRSLEALPDGARVHAFVEVAGPEEEQKIDSDVEVVWLHRGDRPIGEALVEAVRALEFPEGRVHAFVHGEAHFVKELRHLLRVEREVAREDLSISGYWRLGHNEDGWQAVEAGVERAGRGGAGSSAGRLGPSRVRCRLRVRCSWSRSSPRP